MKVIIAGSRHMPLSQYNLINQAVQKSGYQIDEVVSGNANGADTLGEIFADEHGIPCKIFPANWDKYGKAAGPIRNAEMRDYADAAIVFVWDGSRGSINMVNQMKKVNKPVYVVYNGVI